MLPIRTGSPFPERAEVPPGCPVVQNAHPVLLCRPLGSTPITGASTLLLADPTSSGASVFCISGIALIAFPLTSPEDFPSSLSEPESDSRHLYTGHRLANKPQPARLILGTLHFPSFDAV